MKSHLNQNPIQTPKHLNNIIMKKLLMLITILCLSSCITGREEPIENYYGAIIVKKDSAPIGSWFKLKYNGRITGRVYVCRFDHNKYREGDTILPPKEILRINSPQDTIYYNNNIYVKQ